jgi:LPS O-antigen subunit length determinant protein (WzzB/FepE family)
MTAMTSLSPEMKDFIILRDIMTQQVSEENVEILRTHVSEMIEKKYDDDLLQYLMDLTNSLPIDDEPFQMFQYLTNRSLGRVFSVPNME